jgi:hypothetical protein
MYDRNQPIPIATDVENNIAVHGVCVLIDAPHVLNMTPTSGFCDSSPFLVFLRCILVVFNYLFLMPAFDNLHSLIILYKL